MEAPESGTKENVQEEEKDNEGGEGSGDVRKGVPGENNEEIERKRLKQNGNPRSLGFEAGVKEARGRRPYMEDRSIVVSNLFTYEGELGDEPEKEEKPSDREHWEALKSQVQRCALFGVFDGHGGHCTSSFIIEHLPSFLLKCLRSVTSWTEEEVHRALRETFIAIDAYLRQTKFKETRDDGSTAVVVLLLNNNMYIAHSGDSRAVLCRNGGAVGITQDHKPTDPKEKERIEKAGGVIDRASWFGLKIGPPRIYYPSKSMGGLAVARGFGDFQYKDEATPPETSMVSVVPDISTTALDKEDEILVIASDGLFDVMTNDVTVKLAKDSKDEGKTAEETACVLVESALKLESTDNVTALCVYLSPLLDNK